MAEYDAEPASSAKASKAHEACSLADRLDRRLTVVACGSASGTVVTVGYGSAVAEPGQPVPASAIHRLTAIADRAVPLNGGHPVARATAVVTTHAKTLTSATPGGTTPGAKDIVLPGDD